MGRVDPEGDLTGDDIVYAYPDYKTLLVGKFRKGVMIATSQSFTTGITFDDISKIPTVIPGKMIHPEDVFGFDEADKTIISRNPTLQGMIQFLCCWLKLLTLKELRNFGKIINLDPGILDI
jgi:hypothetical protein